MEEGPPFSGGSAEVVGPWQRALSAQRGLSGLLKPTRPGPLPHVYVLPKIFSLQPASIPPLPPRFGPRMVWMGEARRESWSRPCSPAAGPRTGADPAPTSDRANLGRPWKQWGRVGGEGRARGTQGAGDGVCRATLRPPTSARSPPDAAPRHGAQEPVAPPPDRRTVLCRVRETEVKPCGSCCSHWPWGWAPWAWAGQSSRQPSTGACRWPWRSSTSIRPCSGPSR